MFPNLSGWRVNLSLLQEAASKELLGLLDKCNGTKVHKFLLLIFLSLNLMSKIIIFLT